MLNVPSGDVFVKCCSPVALLMTVILADGTTAPLLSVTVPLIPPISLGWAWIIDEELSSKKADNKIAAIKTKRMVLIWGLLILLFFVLCCDVINVDIPHWKHIVAYTKICSLFSSRL